MGCAHAGVINTLRYVRHLSAGRPIHAVLGGMHLLNFNQLALGLLPAFRQHLREAPDPWDVAVRLAAAGNVMDLGVKSGLDESEIRIALEHCLTEPFDGSPAEFAEAVAAAKRILYLTDNAGEIVVDGTSSAQDLHAEIDRIRSSRLTRARTMADRISHDYDVGWDDIVYAAYMHPPLTTVRMPKTALGDEAMRLLLALMADPALSPDPVVLDAALVVRGTT